MKRTVVIVLLLSLGLNLGLALGLLRGDGGADRSGGLREPGQHRLDGPQHPRGRVEHMARVLQLDDDQREAMWALHERLSNRVFAQRREMAEVRGRLRTLLTDPATTLRDLEPILARQADVRATLDSLVVVIMLEERALLTEQQLQAYPEFLAPLGRGGGGGPGPRHGPPGRARRGRRPGA